MSFRAPLTRAQLHDIGIRKDPGDINALLWEIKRLRALVLPDRPAAAQPLSWWRSWLLLQTPALPHSIKLA